MCEASAGLRNHVTRIVQVYPVPVVAVAATDTRQVRPGPLGAPLERVIVDEFTRHRIVAIAFRLGTERPDHLRVAEIAAFTYVDIAPGQSQRRIGFQPRHRFRGGMLEEQRHDLHQPADGHHEGDQDDHQTDVFLNLIMCCSHDRLLNVPLRVQE
jgi:hypothetical protein